MAWIILGWWLWIPGVREMERRCWMIVTHQEKTWASGPIPRILLLVDSVMLRRSQILGKICSSFLSWLLKADEMMSSTKTSSNNKPSFWSQPPRSTFATTKRAHHCSFYQPILESVDLDIHVSFVTTRNTQITTQPCFRKLLGILDSFVKPTRIYQFTSKEHLSLPALLQLLLISSLPPPKVL